MDVLVIDIGGTNIKFLATGQPEPRRFPSGPTMTPTRMVAGVREATADWKYDAVVIGYPGQVVDGKIITEPKNLGPGWVGFNFRSGFRRPVKLINDAAMQALGSYKDGTMLFLGLGTGLGSALVVDGKLVPMELAHLSVGKGGVFEDYLGARAVKRFGKRKWRKFVEASVARLQSALQLDDVVIGGGNARKLKKLPPGCRAGDNANAFIGGFRLWEQSRNGGRAAGKSGAPQRKKSRQTARTNLKTNTGGLQA